MPRFRSNLLRRAGLIAPILAAGIALVPANAVEDEPQAVALKVAPPAYMLMTDRMLVYLHADAGPRTQAEVARLQPMSVSAARDLSVSARTLLSPVRRMADGGHVMRLTHPMFVADVQRMADSLKQDPTVAHAEPDHRRFPQQTATERFDLQWNLASPTSQAAGDPPVAAGGLNVKTAWSNVTESTSVRVAVLDTGILRGHPDLPNDRLLDGYDFISADSDSSFSTANDGNGRDDDESDPGNWISAADLTKQIFSGCSQDDSDWHGTHTTGIIAAATNSVGIRGINRNARILPVRVLGKCGGYTSDILDGMKWAVGLAVPGVRTNTTPAQILNLSLGGPGTGPNKSCSTTEQNAINDVLAAGAKAIVVAAGNDNGADAATSSPGNCSGVINVAAVDRNGSLAAYSNVGSIVTVAAPGGFFVTGGASQDGILSLFNGGTTTPLAYPSGGDYAYVIGTSEATAHVSGVASLMLSKNPNLTAAQVKSVLRTSARSFPNSSCSTCTCGAGIVDAGNAVQQSVSPPADSTASCSAGGGSSSSGGGGGGGGGGGCAIGGDGTPDVLLLCLFVLAAGRLAARRR